MNGAASVFLWWFTFLGIGAIFFPLSRRLFHRFVDQGYIAGKVVGIVVLSYTMWFLGSFHILPFHRLALLLLFIGFFLFNLSLMRRHKGTVQEIPWRWIILEELLFFLVLAGWSYVKATEPFIRGLEKFMDFGFMNSILRGNFFPPLDMWLTKSPDYTGGFTINYYYYGHYIAAFLTKLTGIDPAITYNLMIATVAAFTFTLSFSIVVNLIGSLVQHITPKLPIPAITLSIVGILAGFVVAFGGNPHTLYVFTEGYPNEDPVAPWELQLGFHPDRYWYPNATRFIPNTIHEFPAYSFVVSDLHGHVSSIPLVLLGIAMLFHLLLERVSPTNEKKESFHPLIAEFQDHTGFPFFPLAFYGILVATMYMTNAWDGLIYLVLGGLVFLTLNIRSALRQNQESWVTVSLVQTFSASLFLLFFFLIGSLPFSLNFKPFVSGIGVLCAPNFLADKTIGPLLFEKNHCQRSPWWMMLILWGYFYYAVIGFVRWILVPKFQEWWKLLKQTKRGKFSAITLYPSDIFVALLIFLSTLLLIFPEFFYIKDIYPEHYRANTMFKLGYQAFMMLGICSIYIMYRIRTSIVKTIATRLFMAGFAVLFSLVAIYPYFAVNSYFGGLKTYHGLNGLTWLLNEFPDDYAAIEWIRTNITCADLSEKTCTNQPVIVEANGESYTDYARVSANTGLPTLIGWPVHEWLWRGSFDEAGRRIPEVDVIYQSADPSEVRRILAKYNVSYIFAGDLERQKYPQLDGNRFAQFGDVVFESGATKIYKVTR